jgi:serine O-acetyltransferase
MGLWEDAKNIRDKDPAARNVAEVIILYPGFHVLVTHKIAHFLYNHKCFFLARLVSQLARHLTGIEIHPGAKIGRKLFIDHGMGVVIGETTVIGDNCTLYQGVTLGGTGKDQGKRHPTLGNDVLVGAGAKVLGPITLGRNVKVGAGAIVLKSVPEGCTVVGNPGRVVRKGSIKCVGPDLDQIHLPDPVKERLEALQRRIDQLEICLERKNRGEKCEDCEQRNTQDCPQHAREKEKTYVDL